LTDLFIYCLLDRLIIKLHIKHIVRQYIRLLNALHNQDITVSVLILILIQLAVVYGELIQTNAPCSF